MILIADSGSTKTDWTVINEDDTITRLSTKGINPFFQSKEEIAEEIKDTLLPQLPSTAFNSIYFYGAGCAFDDKIKTVKDALLKHLTVSESVEVNSDMLAAAHALCGREPGIACILGTGSNSCAYDGEKITDNVSPLGFILGDEGSGAVIGRLFVGSLLKNQLTKGLKEKFLEEFDIEPAEIIDRVYRKPFPNRFLASLSPFIKEHIEDKTVRNIVLGSFEDFFQKNVMQYEYKSCKVHFIGSIAQHYKEVIAEAAKAKNIEIGNILKSPMEGLIKYHLNK